MGFLAKIANSVYVGSPACRILVLAVLVSALNGNAQTWRALGPEGGDVFALAMDPHNPKTLYLGCADGHIFGSRDAGDHWQILGRAGESGNSVVSSIVIDERDSRRLYASTWTREPHGEGGGVFRSSDAGVHWTSTGLAGHAVRALEQAPSNPRELVAGALDGVFLSSDAGATWRRISPAGNAELSDVDSIAIDPKDAKVVYAGTFHLPWKTTDAGLHWVSIHLGMIDDSDVFSLVVDRQDTARVFASACSGIYRSDNGGALWMKIQGIPFSARRTHVVLQDPSHPQIVYAGTTEGLWKTSDGGSEWKLITPASWVINSMVVEPGTGRVVIGTAQMGVLVSDDGGQFFRVSNDGFYHRQITAFAVDLRQPGHLMAVVANAPETMLETEDDGQTWFPLGGSLDADKVREAYASPRGWIVALKEGGLQLYAPRFRLWRALGQIVGGPNTWPFHSIVNSMAFSDRGWFAATADGLFVSADGGEMWRRIPLGRAKLSADAVVSSPDGSVLWVVSSGGMLYSGNSGRTWSWKDLPIQSGGVISLQSDGEKILLASSERGLYVSRDAGETWSLAGHGLPASPPEDVAVAGQVWIASMHTGGVYVSRNGGASWTRGQSTVAEGFFPVISAAKSLDNIYLGSATDGLYSIEVQSDSAAKHASQSNLQHSPREH